MEPLEFDASGRPPESESSGLGLSKNACSIRAMSGYSDNIAYDIRKSVKMNASNMIVHHALRIQAEKRKPTTYPNPPNTIILFLVIAPIARRPTTTNIESIHVARSVTAVDGVIEAESS